MALKIYGIIYLAFTAFYIQDLLVTGQLNLVYILSILFSTMYVIGLWGYIFRKAIFTAGIWLRIFYLACFGTSLLLIKATITENNIVMYTSLFGVLFSVPLIVVLYKYSNKDLPLWLSEDFINKGEVLSEMLSGMDELTATKETESNDSIRINTVKVTQNDKGFLVQLSKEKNGTREEYSEKFDNLGAVAKYIENYSMIKTNDLEPVSVQPNE